MQYNIITIMEVLTDKLKYETNNINKVIPLPMK